MKIKKRLAVLVIVIFSVLAVLVVSVVLIGQQLNKGLSVFENIVLTDPDLSRITDGVYPGSFTQMPIAVEVEVTVTNHTITDIRLLKHNNGQGAAAETIPAQVVAAQSVEHVDAVAGATYSSKAILKAVEQALSTANPTE